MEGIKEKLADLRKEIGAISKNKENPFFNSAYFDINELLKQLQPHLDERGLLLTQPIKEGKVVTYIEDIDSGECRESELLLPDGVKPQDMGSAITYYRRYTLQSLLALQAEDDDGNLASKPQKKNGEEKEWLNKTQYNSDEIHPKWIKATRLIRAGKYTAQQIIDSYQMKKELESELKQIEEKAKNNEPAKDNN